MSAKIVDVRGGSNGQGPVLPPPRKTIHMEYTDQESKLLYAGDFTVKRLTLGDMRRVAIKRAELSGGVKADALDMNTQAMNTMLAHLEVAIEKAPEWWKPSDFYTADPIADLYEKVIDFEDSFRRPKEAGPQGLEGDSEGAAQ
jgi:hypothetical protein